MNRFVLVLFGLSIVPLLSVRADPPARDGIAHFVEQLGSARFAEREAASKALAAVGPPALPVLRAAAAGDDTEVRRRAQRLIARSESWLVESGLTTIPLKHAHTKDVAQVVAETYRGMPSSRWQRRPTASRSWFERT